MKKIIAIIVSIAAMLIVAPSASAYLNVHDAAVACSNATYTTAAQNLANYHYGISDGGYIYNRFTDSHVKIFEEFDATASFGPTSYFDASGQAWYLYEEMSCDVYGSNASPSVGSIADYGVAWRHTLGAP